MDTLARLAPRLALGVVITLTLGVGFVPTVIRIYAARGSLAGLASSWTLATFSLAANVVVAAIAVAVLRLAVRRGPPDR